MTYANAVKYLSSLKRGEVNAERANRIRHAFEESKKPVKAVHVIGKYGKNSSHRMLSSILIDSGISVGGFSLCPTCEPREAITVNLSPVSHNDFAEAVSTVKSVYESEDAPSYEEFLALVALVCFIEKNVDVTIFEQSARKNGCALITDTPVVTLITSIIDPTTDELLFLESFDKVAKETVSATQSKSVYALISERCVEMGSRLTIPLYSELEINKINLFKTSFSYRGEEYSIRSFSPCQTINAIAVIETAKALSRVGFNLTDENIRCGIERATLPAKCEAISLEPAIIVCDVSSNVKYESTIASIAQIRDFIPKDIHIAISPDSEIECDGVRRSLSSANISSVNFLKIQEDLTPAKFAKHIASLVDPLLSEDGKNDALVFMGDGAFVTRISEIVKKHLGKI